MAANPFAKPLRILGRYALYGRIASGGMATVHLGRLVGPVGFARTVAIKCLHPVYAKDPEFAAMFLDEARVAARIRHPSVVQTLDVVKLESELFLIMDYVQGESFSRLLTASAQKQERIPLGITVPILVSVLHGLHAAHEATNERGEPLGIVHRDVSPHNIMVGVDGVARVLDFGVAKATGRVQSTRAGQLKGKIPYMSPEQIGGAVTRASDIYACSVVLWEALTSRRLFQDETEVGLMAKVAEGNIAPPSRFSPHVPAELEAITLRGLAKNPADRFETARDMARALEKSVPLATATEIGEWVERLAGVNLAARAAYVKEMERHSLDAAPPSAPAKVHDSDDFDLRDTIVQSQPGAAHDDDENKEAPADTVAAAAAAAAPAPAPQTVPAPRDPLPTTREGAANLAPSPPPPPTNVPAPPVVPETEGGEAMPTQFSTGSATARPGGEPPRMSRTVKVGILMAAGLFALVVTIVVIVGRRTSQATTHPVDPITQDPPAPTAQPSAALVLDAQGPPDPSAANSGLAIAGDGGPNGVHVVAPPPSGHARVSCNPPYTLDALGLKRYKRECLK